MTVFLEILLGISVFVVIFGHFILSIIDRYWVYPKRLAKVQPEMPSAQPVDRPPSDLSPALVSRLVFFGNRKGGSYTQFAVTLMDLVHRKKIYVDHKSNELIFIPLDDGHGLQPFEQTLLTFLLEAAGENSQITLTYLKSYIEEHPEQCGEMRKKFQREVIDAFLAQGFSDEVSYEHKQNPFLLIGKIALVVGAGALLGWLAGSLTLGVVSLCFAGLAFAVCYQVFSYKLPYLTEKGMQMKAEWLAYGQYLDELKCAGQKAASLSPERWCEVAVYAAAMEKNKTFDELSSLWETLADDYPECELYDPHFYKKICSIDHAILVANIHLEDMRETCKVE